jgi:hypothetical protein
VPTGWRSLVALELGFGVELADAVGAGSGVQPAKSTVPTDAATISARARFERGEESKEGMNVSL